jgi:hypothetical protein
MQMSLGTLGCSQYYLAFWIICEVSRGKEKEEEHVNKKQ